MYEHGEPWWNDVDRGKLLAHQSSLAIQPAVLSGSKQEEWMKGMFYSRREAF
jgi:hypothetical protein